MSDRQELIDRMRRERPVIFGDPNDFAIRYVPGYRSGEWRYAWLHLVIRGEVIGDPSEECLVSTWLISIANALERVEDAATRLSHPAFAGYRDDELFAMVWKSNGAMDPAYGYLPTLPGSVWANCSLSIDETTDAWLVGVVFVHGQLRFLWKGWRPPCPYESLGLLKAHGTSTVVVAKVFGSALEHVRNSAATLPSVD
jgi:hypothetical protein